MVGQFLLPVTFQIRKKKKDREIKYLFQSHTAPPEKLMLESSLLLLHPGHCQTSTSLELQVTLCSWTSAPLIFLAMPTFPFQFILCTYLDTYNSVIMYTQSSVPFSSTELNPEGLSPSFLGTGNSNKYQVEAFKGGNDPLCLLRG